MLLSEYIFDCPLTTFNAPKMHPMIVIVNWPPFLYWAPMFSRKVPTANSLICHTTKNEVCKSTLGASVGLFALPSRTCSVLLEEPTWRRCKYLKVSWLSSSQVPTLNGRCGMVGRQGATAFGVVSYMGHISQSAYWTKIGHFLGEFEPILWQNSKWYHTNKKHFLAQFFG